MAKIHFENESNAKKRSGSPVEGMKNIHALRSPEGMNSSQNIYHRNYFEGRALA